MIESHQSEYLCTKVNEMYDSFSEELQSNLDLKQLGLKKEYILSEKADGILSGKKSKLFTEIAMKWDARNLGIKEVDRGTECTDLSECRVLKRIEFVMDLFDRYFLKQFVDGKGDEKTNDDVLYIDILTECLSDYNGIALIDDLNHIREHKGDIRSVIGTYCDRIDGKDAAGKCIGEMMRKHRESERTEKEIDADSDGMDIEFKRFVNGLGLRERHLLETSVKIHSFICHEVHGEDDEKESDDDTQHLKGTVNEQLISKFVNEIESGKKSEKVEEKRMEDLAESLRANGFSDDECDQFMEMLLDQSYDSETIIDDLVDGEYDPFNPYPDTNLFPMLRNNVSLAKTVKNHFGINSEKVDVKRMDDLAESLRANGLSDGECARFMNELATQSYDSETIFDDLMDEERDPSNLNSDSNVFAMLQKNLFFTKITKKHFGAKMNDDDELPSFTFGRDRLRHYEYFKDRPNYVGVPKYSNLKEECLQNRIHQIPIKQFSRMLYEAFLFAKSKNGQALKALDRGSTNSVYEMPPECPLSVSHIFVLRMYCNLTDLQKEYKECGCRERDSGQTLEELKKWNREIAHWHRLVVEAVVFFGEKVRPNSSKQVFFTGLSIKLCFTSFAPKFNAPFSTTVSVAVAARFSGSNGLILKLKPAPGSKDSYFNVEWLSDFADEKERLFVFALNMMIADIKYSDGANASWADVYLRGFTLFSSLFTGHFVSSLLRIKKRKKQLNLCRALLDLITVYKATNGIGDAHYDALDIRIPLYIQQLFFQLLDEFRKDKGQKLVIKSNLDLLDETLSRELIVFSVHNTDHRKMTLSPLLRSLCQKEQIEVMQEYLWMIENVQFNKLQSATSAMRIYSKMHQYHVADLGKQVVSLRFSIDRKSSGTTLAAFGVEIEQSPYPLDGRMSVEIDEVKWNFNDIRFFAQGSGGQKRIFAFKDSLYESTDKLKVKVALRLTKTLLSGLVCRM